VDLEELERYIQLDVDRWRTSRVRASRKRNAGRVFQAPSPGSHHIKRSVLQQLVASLLKGDGAGVTRAVLHGAPGIGKSTLAAAFAHDAAVERAFPNGVLWVTLGKRPDVLRCLASWGKALTDPRLPEQGYPTIPSAIVRLKSLMHDRAYLLIVDDAWSPNHVDPFLIGGPRCLSLVTTRQEQVATRIEAQTSDFLIS
jgi:hypothetical protein